MLFEESFEVGADLCTVWDFFVDFEKVAWCIPGLEQFSKVDDGRYRAVLKQRISYLSLEEMKYLAWETRGKAMKLPSGIRMNDFVELEAANNNSPSTSVRYQSNTAITGKLATLGNTIIKVKAKEVMDQFTINVSARFANDGQLAGK